MSRQTKACYSGSEREGAIWHLLRASPTYRDVSVMAVDGLKGMLMAHLQLMPRGRHLEATPGRLSEVMYIARRMMGFLKVMLSFPIF
jgi:hypothetical protein